MTIKILNLYAGIGGNRKLWPNEEIEVTVVEINPEIAKIYSDFFPQDKMVVGDAHQYLLDHYKEFDFIWSSPPCPTHSTMRNLKNNCEETEKKFPDMKLYEEIIYLSYFFKGKYCVENVISYYDPLIKPQVSNNHYFWCNFLIPNEKKDERQIRGNIPNSMEYKQDRNGFDVSKLDIPNKLKEKILNNCVKPEVGLSIFQFAFKKKQMQLNDIEIIKPNTLNERKGDDTNDK
jgi:DNA (cytosine-5)-methyltransferase 1